MKSSNFVVKLKFFMHFSVTNGKHEFVPKNVFAEAEKFAKVFTRKTKILFFHLT